ncbi:MAG: hypothetical protein AAB865_00770 [Patescibacteria group bacterium]
MYLMGATVALMANLGRASRLQHMMSVGLIIIAMFVTWQCVKHSVDPTIDTQVAAEKSYNLGMRQAWNVPAERHEKWKAFVNKTWPEQVEARQAREDERRAEESDRKWAKAQSEKLQAQFDTWLAVTLAPTDKYSETIFQVVSTVVSLRWWQWLLVSAIVGGILYLRYGGPVEREVTDRYTQENGMRSMWCERSKYPFGRTKVDGEHWKLRKDFWGRWFLCDRYGGRISYGSSAMEVLWYESLLDYAMRKREERREGMQASQTAEARIKELEGHNRKWREHGEALKTAIVTRNRLLVLVVGAIRASKDFVRSDTLRIIQENLVIRMREAIPLEADPELWAEFERRHEEERLSLKRGPIN